ncbi:MAG: Glutamate-tRNA ligase [Parcubacteria group bacterium GW2011_GWA2_49_9]|nr:MAG: Glutamate-tRNA ligase [Parcubacteria group bacterium GW2011_GWA2_49_9]
MTVITRFPPSPTGFFHIGRARTFLFNYLFTRQNGGKIVFRIEDTDKERSKIEYEKDIIDGLRWLGITWDNAVIARQSERNEIYKKYLQKIIADGNAYLSKETPEKEGERAEVIRFKNPKKVVTFTDIIRGEVSFDTTDLGDFVIAKSLEEPIYHLSVVVDDFEMGVTHVIRGEDGISNTPRQILIQEAIEAPRPLYAHVPLILAEDRSKLSARHGAVGVTEYRTKGYLPEAIINYLALLGWNPGTDQELFTLEELIGKFDLAKVQKGGAIFSEEKLRWVNKEYLKKAGVKAVIPYIPAELTKGKSELQIQALAEMLLERISVYGDMKTELTAGEYDYLLKKPVYPKEMLRWKKAKSEPQEHLENVCSLVEKISPDAYTVSGIKEALFPYAEAKGKGDVLWPTRVALSGKEQSPDPFTLAAILGKEETLARLQSAVKLLG